MGDTALFDLGNKQALITGGASGIGRSAALAFARAGANVAIVDINPELGEVTAQQLRELGVKSHYIHCDISDKAQVQAMVARVVDEFGRLDIAVNSAGIGLSGPDEACSLEDWQRVIDINLTGTWLCAQAQAQQMIKQTACGGKIINLASMCADITIPGCGAAYDVSKAAVVRMTQSLALQWGRFNINVNSISPSHVMTPMFAEASMETRERIRAITPLGHLQRPRDLHGPLIFLASAASDYMTGQNLLVDGGHCLSTYLVPLKREVPPRIDPEQELLELKQDFKAMGIACDAQGFPVGRREA